MKKTSFIGYLLFLTLIGYGQSPQILSLEQATIQAQNESKLILVFVNSSFCKKCETLKKAILSDDNLLSSIEPEFVITEIDYLFHDDLIKRYNLSSYSSIFILNENGERLKKMLGHDIDSIKEQIALSLDNVEEYRSSTDDFHFYKKMDQMEATPELNQKFILGVAAGQKTSLEKEYAYLCKSHPSIKNLIVDNFKLLEIKRNTGLKLAKKEGFEVSYNFDLLFFFMDSKGDVYDVVSYLRTKSSPPTKLESFLELNISRMSNRHLLDYGSKEVYLRELVKYRLSKTYCENVEAEAIEYRSINPKWEENRSEMAFNVRLAFREIPEYISRVYDKKDMYRDSLGYLDFNTKLFHILYYSLSGEGHSEDFELIMRTRYPLIADELLSSHQLICQHNSDDVKKYVESGFNLLKILNYVNRKKAIEDILVLLIIKDNSTDNLNNLKNYIISIDKFETDIILIDLLSIIEYGMGNEKESLKLVQHAQKIALGQKAVFKSSLPYFKEIGVLK